MSIINSLITLDHELFIFINKGLASKWGDIVFPVLRNKLTWIPLYIFTLLYLYKKYNNRSIIYILLLLFAFAISDYVNHNFIKTFFARIRPCHQTDLSVRLVLDYCRSGFSFPSNHAANHMALAISICLSGIAQNTLSRLSWIIWAVAIGFAQIYVGIHYPADILSGFIFGAIVAIINYYLFFPLLEKVYTKFRN